MIILLFEYAYIKGKHLNSQLPVQTERTNGIENLHTSNTKQKSAQHKSMTTVRIYW